MTNDIPFEIGGRYKNRIGWYEVLDIYGDEIKVCYEEGGKEDSLKIEMQKRIIANITTEEESELPYRDSISNQKYYKTLGIISNYGFIEAMIPIKSKRGFDNYYVSLKDRCPQNGQDGYYLHSDANVDKWGVEMRLTLPDVADVALGALYTTAASPEPDRIRVNSNTLCYELLRMGFDLGSKHDLSKLESNIPANYKKDFQDGLNIVYE
jgi:hypothetical protein